MKSPISIWLLLAVLYISLSITAYSETVFKQNDVLTICGDSLTEQGGYSVFMEEYIFPCQPVNRIKIFQCGAGGDTAPHFAARMKDTALTLSPTVATLLFAVNDAGWDNTSEIREKTYRDGLTTAIRNFKAHGVRVIIVGATGAVDTFYFKNRKHKEVTAQDFNRTLGRFGEIAKEVAKSEGVLFADLHTPMMETMAKAKAALGEKYPVFGDVDGVHPTPNGQLIIAYAFLKAMGFDGNIGTITYDDETGTTEATEGQKVISSKKGEFIIESTRYPFCFVHSNDHPIASSSTILPFLPFNEELNRYTLVVKNLKTSKAKITWGKESKEFTTAQLLKGINLAAEFLTSPFQAAFLNIDAAVSKKHTFQTMFIKDYLLVSQPELLQSFPAKINTLKAIDAGFREFNDGMNENCVKSVKSVTHTIKVEAVN